MHYVVRKADDRRMAGAQNRKSMSSLLDNFLGQPFEGGWLRVIVKVVHAPVRQYGLLLDGGAPRALAFDRSLVHGL